ncbi:MAG: transglycosylase protein [Clostridiaceae bacterium]|jgi:soluble lytic murein transglycosylase-like protein|nr:transglycosylase protein [Clostridiaceae bacterium]
MKIRDNFNEKKKDFFKNAFKITMGLTVFSLMTVTQGFSVEMKTTENKIVSETLPEAVPEPFVYFSEAVKHEEENGLLANTVKEIEEELRVAEEEAERIAKETKAPESDFVPLPIEQQDYLFKLCKERNVDYKTALAVMKIESRFDVNAYYKGNYGYFQINHVNHDSLTKLLETTSNPLEPYTNINWGTHMLSDLFKQYTDAGLTGETLINSVLSSYNKGIGGFNRTGYATKYIEKYNIALEEINGWF